MTVITSFRLKKISTQEEACFSVQLEKEIVMNLAVSCAHNYLFGKGLGGRAQGALPLGRASASRVGRGHLATL